MRSSALFEEYGVENCIIELIEARPCIDIDDQGRLEGSYIQMFDCANKISQVELLNHKEKIVKKRSKKTIKIL
jgi:hypothetical protein